MVRRWRGTSTLSSRRSYGDNIVLKLDSHAGAELLPWFFAAQTYLLEHEPPVHDLLGIAIGHSYTVLRQRKRLAAPGALRAVYEARPELMAKYEAFAEEFS